MYVAYCVEAADGQLRLKVLDTLGHVSDEYALANAQETRGIQAFETLASATAGTAEYRTLSLMELPPLRESDWANVRMWEIWATSATRTAALPLPTTQFMRALTSVVSSLPPAYQHRLVTLLAFHAIRQRLGL